MHHNSNERVFRVLSIDGGGIKGLYSAEILRHFEDQYGCSIADHFDLIGGTSTGGLIALALAMKIPAKDVVEFYFNHGPKIFPKHKSWMALWKRLSRGHLYSPQPLRTALDEMFGSSRMCDIHSLVCIPSYNLTEGRPCIFKYDHKQGELCRDNNTLISEIALATAAAPTYLPVATIDTQNGHQFVDGGVYANNPTLICTIEALNYFVGEGKAFDALEVLSISSLERLNGTRIRKKQPRILTHLTKEIAPAITSGQSHIVTIMMSTIQKLPELRVKFHRIPSEPVSASQASDVALDTATHAALTLISGKGNDAGLKWRKDADIRHLFATRKIYDLED